MSSIAQEESWNISENVTWGMRKHFADGRVSMTYGQFMGYHRGMDGSSEIVEAEAKIVRTIFRRFLEGATPAIIARELNNAEIYLLFPQGLFPMAVELLLQNRFFTMVSCIRQVKNAKALQVDGGVDAVKIKEDCWQTWTSKPRGDVWLQNMLHSLPVSSDFQRS